MIGELDGLTQLVFLAEQQELGVLDLGFDVAVVETNGLLEFPVRFSRLFLTEVGLREPVVSRGVIRIDLKRVLVLDHRFGELLSLEIPLPAFFVLAQLDGVVLACQCEEGNGG